MAATKETTLNLPFNGPCRAGAPLYPFFFPIGSPTISQFSQEPLPIRTRASLLQVFRKRQVEVRNLHG
jgi:hypothetical protein